MKDLKKFAADQKPELVKPDLKYIILAVVILAVLLYAAYHAVHLDFKFFTFLNRLFREILRLIDVVINVPADLFRRLFKL